MKRYENEKGPGPGNNTPQKQNEQDGSATNISGEMKNGHGVRSHEYSAPKKPAKQKHVKSPKVFPPPGFKESK